MFALTSNQKAIWFDQQLFPHAEAELFRYPGISTSAFTAAYELTTTQRDIYLTSILDPEGSGLRLLVYFEITGPLNVEDWKAAIEKVIAQEDSLRSTLIIKDTTVFQAVKKTTDVNFTFIDIDGTHADIARLVKEHCQENQDLAHPLLKHYLFRITPNRYIGAVSAHHLFVDGVSFQLMVEKIDRAYHQQDGGDLAIIPYREYVFNHLQKFDTAAVEHFWRHRLSEAQPLSYAGVLNREDQVLSDTLRIPGAEAIRIKDYCNAHRIKPSLFFKGIYALLVKYYCNADHDYCIRENLAGRGRRQLDLVGCVSHCFPLLIGRDIFRKAVTFDELWAHLQEQKLSANEFRHISLSLQNRIIGDEKLSFFYNYQYFNLPETTLTIGLLEQVYQPMNNQLELRIVEMPDAFELKLDHNEQIFHGERFLSRVRHVATQVLEGKKVGEVELLTGEELQQLDAFGNNPGGLPEKNLLGLIEEQVRSRPEHIALVFRDRPISYAELDKLSDSVAVRLEKLSLARESVVGIMIRRSEWTVITLLGVLKAGAAFLPIDPDYPKERIDYLLRDSQTRLLLTHAEWKGQWGEKVETVAIEEIPIVDQRPATVKIDPRQLAYVIYTSGTTGNPKGVMIEHQSLANIAKGWKEFYRLDTFDVCLLQLASFSFDVFPGDVIRTLPNGGKMVICPTEVRPDIPALYELIAEHQVNIFESTPALIGPLMEYIHAEGKDFSFFKILIPGSDLLLFAHYKEWQERHASTGLRVVNSYGLTETSIDSSLYEEQADIPTISGSTPIGKPLVNYTYYVCNKGYQLLPVGIPGELLIGGPGVARGYLGKEELTAQKFVPYPHTGEMVYKTGDIVRWLPDGNLEFIGRGDEQVKIRGYRIELSEIEATLLLHQEIREALVTVHDKEEGKELIGWYESRTGDAINGLAQHLKIHLPEYMVPAHFILLDKFPLTPNMKVNRKGLPDPSKFLDKESAVKEVPETETEALLLSIWQEVLKRTHIGMRDNFFELGGHSLKATTAIARIFKTFQVNLPLNQFFNGPTIKGQAAYIDQQARVGVESIRPAAHQACYPLSSSQKRLYLLHQIEGAENSYNMPGAFWVSGEIDRSLLESCFVALIARHEMLRTAFEMRDGEPVQVIKASVAFGIGFTEIVDGGVSGGLESAGSAEDRAANAGVPGEIMERFIRTFDLSAPPLLRVQLYQFGDGRKLLLIDMHHIVADGLSINILTEELARLYNGEKLEPLSIQYKDFAVWQKGFLASAIIREQEKYWLEQFADEVPILDWQTDHPRPAYKSFNGKRKYARLSEADRLGLERLAGELGCTINQLLLAVFDTLLYKYSGNADIVIGTPVSGRTRAELDHVLGMFVNTLALRVHPTGRKTFRELLWEVRQNSIAGLKNQDYPFEILIERLDLKRDMSRNPLFDVMFSFLHEETAGLQIGDAVLEPLEDIYDTSKFDLLLQVTRNRIGIELMIEYSTDLFNEQTISHFLDRYVKLVAGIPAMLDTTLADLDILTAAEREWLLDGQCSTQVGYPEDKCIHELFEMQVKRGSAVAGISAASESQERVALVWEREEMTYTELNKRAGQVAAAIRSRLPEARNPIVAVLLDRGPEMVITLLGVLKAGGAYLPIDPAYPEKHIRYILEDSQAEVLITHSGSDVPAGYIGRVITMDQLREEPVIPVVQVRPDDLAYIIYTSGSTGKPKGVMISHRNVVRLLFNDHNLFDFTEKDVWTLFHSYCFDFSVWEMYGALLYGGKLVIVSRETAQHPALFLQLLKEQQVTILNQTPGSFYHIQDAEMDRPGAGLALRYVIFGGEALKPGKLQSWKERYPQCRLINMYGITETTVHVTYKEIGQQEIDQGASNIGRPIPTLSLIILDRNLSLAPQGVAGELCVGGAGLARGYLNRPELTAERFIDHPYLSGERLYRTGDLAKLLPGGDFEYLGRIDQQVKIRGFRIELGEIESKLLLHRKVRDVLVIDREGDAGSKYLVAYVVAEEEAHATELRSYLAALLPEHMIPAFIVLMDRFPLTGNGKVDRKRLPVPEETHLSTTHYVAPGTATEKELAAIWMKLLHVPKAGLQDQFFEMGGHSLKAAQLVANIHKHFYVGLSIKNIFSTPRLQDMAALIDSTSPSWQLGIGRAPAASYYPASSAEKRLFILNQIDNQGVAYNIPGVYMIEGEVDRQRFSQAITAIIDRHEILRTAFVIKGREVVQEIGDAKDFDIEVYNDLSEDGLAASIEGFVRPFDLSQAPLLRVGLARMASGGCFFLFDIHHIVADAISIDNFIKELSALYGGASLPALSIQYKDFSVWQAKWLQSEEALAQKAYWVSQFREELPLINMPLDHLRPNVKSYEGDLYHFPIPRRMAEAVKELGRVNGATPFMVLLAAYTILLSKYSGQEDITVGTPVAGRSHTDLQDLMGMFVNTIPLRNFPVADKPFTDYLLAVKENALKGFENQYYPFEELLDHLEIRRDMGRNPLFDYMFTYRDGSHEAIRIADLVLKQVSDQQHVSKMDISMIVVNGEDGELSVMIEYATKLFLPDRIKRLARHFSEILAQVVFDPHVTLKDIELATAEERAEVLYTFNDRRPMEWEGRHIYDLFEENASRYPAHIAVEDEQDSLTYAGLQERVGRVADILLEKGCQSDRIIGLYTDRSIDMIIGILAILKAGGAYLPLDTEYPPDRIRYMLEDSAAMVVVTQKRFAGELNFVREKVFLDELPMSGEAPQHGGRSLAGAERSPGDLAYVIYTSGSTGRPKGVQIEHRSLYNFLRSNALIYRDRFSAADRCLSISSISFDASVLEIFIPLSVGARLVLLSREHVYDIQALARALVKKKISFCFIPPSLLPPLYAILKDSGPLCLDKLDCGAEVVKDSILKDYSLLSEQMQIVNSYGPTEAAIVSSCYTYVAGKVEGANVPIGKPIHNARIYIVNEHRKLQPVGVPGELCIGGEGLARGYLNNPELTRQAFIDNPFEQGKKMYLTGDLARWLPDGNIEFIGRKDHQVKIRGLRIELGEIESRLMTHPDIKEVLVIHKTDSHGDPFLCAYIVGTKELDISGLRVYLAMTLPSYMIPSFFIQLERFPLTKSEKVDRKALPEPVMENRTFKSAPVNATEKQLLDIWKVILGVKEIGVGDNFFELGGNSLKIINMLRLIQDALGDSLKVNDLFDKPTIREQAAAIQHRPAPVPGKNKKIKRVAF